MDVGGAKPIRLAPYYVLLCHRMWLKEELDRMMEDGVILVSNSSIGAPIVLVKRRMENKVVCGLAKVELSDCSRCLPHTSH